MWCEAVAESDEGHSASAMYLLYCNRAPSWHGCATSNLGAAEWRPSFLKQSQVQALSLAAPPENLQKVIPITELLAGSGNEHVGVVRGGRREDIRPR
jgi:hypothetical protein